MEVRGGARETWPDDGRATRVPELGGIVEPASDPHGRVREETGHEAQRGGGWGWGSVLCVGLLPADAEAIWPRGQGSRGSKAMCISIDSIVWLFVVAFRGSDGKCGRPAPSHPGGCLPGTTVIPPDKLQAQRQGC